MSTPEASRKGTLPVFTRYGVSPVDAGRQEVEDTKPVLLVDVENRLIGVGDIIMQLRDTVPWKIIQLYVDNPEGHFTSREIAKKLKLKGNNPDPVRLAIKKLNGPEYFGASYITSENDKGKNTYVYRMNARIVLEDLSAKVPGNGIKPGAKPPDPEPEVKRIKSGLVIRDDNILRYRMTTGKLLGPPDPRRVTDMQKTKLTLLAADRRIRKKELMADTKSRQDETEEEWDAELKVLSAILSVFMLEIFEERDEVLHDDFVGMRPIGRKTQAIIPESAGVSPGGTRSRKSGYD